MVLYFLNAMQIYDILIYHTNILQTFLEITRQTPEKDFTNERRRVKLHVHSIFNAKIQQFL